MKKFETVKLFDFCKLKQITMANKKLRKIYINIIY